MLTVTASTDGKRGMAVKTDRMSSASPPFLIDRIQLKRNVQAELILPRKKLIPEEIGNQLLNKFISGFDFH